MASLDWHCARSLDIVCGRRWHVSNRLVNFILFVLRSVYRSFLRAMPSSPFPSSLFFFFFLSLNIISLLPPKIYVFRETIPVSLKTTFPTLSHPPFTQTKLSPHGIKLCFPPRVTPYLSLSIVLEVVVQVRVQVQNQAGGVSKWSRPNAHP